MTICFPEPGKKKKKDFCAPVFIAMNVNMLSFLLSQHWALLSLTNAKQFIPNRRKWVINECPTFLLNWGPKKWSKFKEVYIL